GGPSRDPPGLGCERGTRRVPRGGGVDARRHAPAGGLLRGDARAAADRPVVSRPERRRHRRRRGPRHGPHHPAPRPRRERRVGRHLPLRDLRPGRPRPGARQRPDAGRGGLELAHRGARRPRCRVPRRLRHGHVRHHRELRRHGGRARHRPARDPRLLDPRRRRGRRARHAPPRRGVGRAAVHRGRPAARPRGRDRHPQPSRAARQL
ncbi:MAG: Uncharacterized protein Q1 colocalized with Q, partial [uncultured Nocardioides sp.]